MVKEYKLNIFRALEAIDQGKGGWLAKQSSDARHDFVPLTTLRWTVSVPDSEMASYGLWLVNERVNIHMWKLGHAHPDLIFRLLASCGFGTVLKHTWLAGPVVRSVTDKARALIGEMRPECNDDEISILLSLHTRESFRQYIDESGVQPDDAKAILAAFTEQYGKERQTSETASKTSSKTAQDRKTKTRSKTSAQM